MNYKFSDAERELLLDAAIERAAAGPFAKFIDDVDARARFVAWCRIIGELLAPSPIPTRSIPVGFEDLHPSIDSEEAQQREFARREGLDFDKEFGPIDPRARTPRCVHGKLFSEPCEKCADRCTHGLEIGMPCAACGRGVDPPPPDTAA